MNSPMELLTNKGDREPTFLSDKWNPMLGATLGFAGACFVNWGTRRPVFSGIQKHVIGLLGGGSIGYYFDQKRNAYFADRDAVLRHYIELHPEDFPTTERVKIGSTLEPWAPIR